MGSVLISFIFLLDECTQALVQRAQTPLGVTKSLHENPTVGPKWQMSSVSETQTQAYEQKEVSDNLQIQP